MLKRIDRVQLAVFNRAEAAAGWQNLLGAEHVRDDVVAHLGAKRSVYQVGASEVELLEPDGAGAIDSALRTRGRPHLFAAGAAATDLDALVAHLHNLAVPVHMHAGQAHIVFQEAGENDLRFVLSQDVQRQPVGLIDHLYEATILDGRFQHMVDAVTRLFDLEASHYSRITSEKFGYDGYLTLFAPDQLDRFEVIAPTAPEKTMGRFQARQGRAFYMSFAETPHLLEIESRAKAAGAGLTVERPEGRSESEMADQMWLHPPALGGMMLGLSRRTKAWDWSGRPDRVVRL